MEASLRFAVIAVLAACSADPRPPDAAAVADPTQPLALAEVDVVMTGCAGGRPAESECILSAKGAELRLWVDTDRPPQVRLDAREAPARLAAVAGGYAITVRVRPGLETLGLVVDGARPWALHLRAAPETPMVDAARAELAAAEGARQARLTKARASLASALPSVAAYERIEALRLMVKIDLALGDTAAAAKLGAEALDAALDAGQHGAAIDIAQILVHIHVEQGDAATVRWLLELQQLHLAHVRDHGREALWRYDRGAAAQDDGDVREALAQLVLAEQLSRRLQLPDQELAAASLRAALLGLLGRDAEQAAVVARILEIAEMGDGATACLTAGAVANTAWAVLIATPPDTPSPRVAQLVDYALRQVGPGGSCDVAEHPDYRTVRDDARVTHALEALWRGQLEVAQQRLLTVDEAALVPAARATLAYARALVASRSGQDRDALRHVEAAQRRLSRGANLDPVLGWRVAMLEGEVQGELGRRAAAIDALARAERHVERLVPLVGLQQGRDGLAASLGDSARALVDTYVRAGDAAAALRVARRSRARSFRPLGRTGRVAALTLEERRIWDTHLLAYREGSKKVAADLVDAWKLPKDERVALFRRHRRVRGALHEHLDRAYEVLAAAEARGQPPQRLPQEGETWLLYHQLPQGWVGFAVRSGSLAMQRLGAVDPTASMDALAELLLTPFATEIDQARVVIVMPMGELLGVEFAALPYRGGALIDAADVAYSVDLPKRPSRPPIATPHVVVVGDPLSRSGLGPLPRAHAEARAVADTLAEHGGQVTRLTGPEATHEALTRAMDGAALLHYAGHGPGNRSGWASALPLAGEAVLSVGDILAAHEAPTRVVLTGCSTGRADVKLGQGGMHLAAAFLIGGSDLVVAASDTVPDALAAEFGEQLYRGPGPVSVAAMGQALKTLRTRYPRDWTLFRAWVP